MSSPIRYSKTRSAAEGMLRQALEGIPTKKFGFLIDLVLRLRGPNGDVFFAYLKKCVGRWKVPEVKLSLDQLIDRGVGKAKRKYFSRALEVLGFIAFVYEMAEDAPLPNAFCSGIEANMERLFWPEDPEDVLRAIRQYPEAFKSPSGFIFFLCRNSRGEYVVATARDGGRTKDDFAINSLERAMLKLGSGDWLVVPNKRNDFS